MASTTPHPPDTSHSDQSQVPDTIPLSIAIDSSAPSLCDIPPELRLEIWARLLSLSNTSTYRSYSYTGPIQQTRYDNSHVNQSMFDAAHPKVQNKHSALFISKQFSSEYRQCYYERTTFFLRIDHENAMNAVSDWTERSVKVPRFWGDSDLLVSNLRHCTLYIELCDIVSFESSSSRPSVPGSFHNASSPKNSERIPLPASHTQDPSKSPILAAILSLLSAMQQLRTINFVWVTTRPQSRWSWDRKDACAPGRKWEELGQPVVEILKGKRNITKMRIKVGNQWQEIVWSGEREKGIWEGELEGYPDEESRLSDGSDLDESGF
ncbi:hypothetical protein CC80DRAFT_76908 [Byssothecium circinans]|uniref:F-box domain-containing protein n=1 Tax=Byssothecium circinans TaxID=147558 RepID=A0A6A5TTP0_9PLEO|nr:hypothetical protein CC80DRAFT_76908 [Byssothecium circinans]